MPFAVVIVAVWLVASGTASAQEVYRWTDERGTVHFTDRPPVDTPAEQVNVSYRRTDRQAMREQLSARAEQRDAAQLRESQQSEVAVAEQEQRDAIARQRSDNCEAARERLNRYQTAHRLYRPGSDGEREYLNDEELDTARADASRLVSQWCDQ